MANSKLFLDSGYVNIEWILSLGYPFNFIWGARGTGKTYGALKYVLENDTRFMLTRTRQKQADMIKRKEFSPFKPLNEDLHTLIITEALGKDYASFYHGVYDENDKLKPYGEPIGVVSALSTIGDLRGFSAEDITLWIYDEFIQEKGEMPLKNQGFLFANGYETINRNRELKGKKPLQVLCMSNSENPMSEIFIFYGLLLKVAEMNRTGQETCFYPERGIALFNLRNSPISQKKAETALYKAVDRTSDFYRMAIENDFYSLSYEDVKSQNIQEYRIICTVGEISVYEHKSRDEIYISPTKSGTPLDTFTTDERSLKAFIRKYIWLWDYYLEYRITFENPECKLLLEKYFGK